MGVRLSDDHTTKQRTVLKELRRQGLTAYFRGARLISRPGPKSDTRHQAAPEDLDTLHRSSDEEHQSSATLPDAVHRLCDGPSKDQCSSGHRPTDHHSPDHRSPDHRSTDHHSTDHRFTDCQSPGHRSFDYHSQTTVPLTTVPSTTVPWIIAPLTTVPPTTVPLTPVPLTTVPLTPIPTDRRFPDHRSPTRHSTGRHSPDRRPDHRSSGHRHMSSPPSTSSDGPVDRTPPTGREVMNAAWPPGSSRRSRSQGRSLDYATPAPADRELAALVGQSDLRLLTDRPGSRPVAT